MINKDEKIKLKKCAVCGKPVKINQFDCGKCNKCGWYNNEQGEHLVSEIIGENLITFMQAKNLYKEGKPLKPTFNEFFEAMQDYGEMSFNYHGRNFAIIFNEEDRLCLYEKKLKKVFKNLADLKNLKRVRKLMEDY